MRIAFTVPGSPVAQPRQRTRIMVVRGKSLGQNYTPSDHPVRDFKACVKIVAAQAYQGPPLEGPLRVSITFVLPRPSRLCWKKRAMPREWAPSKPDRDNADKAILDSLTGILWVDDKQAVAGEIIKVYASGSEQAHTEIVVEELDSYTGAPLWTEQPATV